MIKGSVNCVSLVDKSQVEKHFGHSAATYRQGAQLQRLVGTRLLDLLQSDSDGICLDLGCGPGLFSESLNRKFPTLLSLDLSLDMLKQNVRAHNRVRVDGHALPFCNESVDAVFSSLMVQWCDFERVIGQIYGALKPGGQAVISTLITGTLFELASAWSKVNDDRHIHDYLDLEYIKHKVSALPWSQQSMSTETQVFWFDNAKALAKELKSLGANYVEKRSQKGLLTKSKWMAMEAAYAQRFIDPGQNKVPATYQILYINLVK